LLRKGHDVKLLTIGLSLLLWPLLPAHAIDPGRAKGFLQAGAERVPIVEALAHFHDNAEGLLDRPRELRILLADREVPQEALAGIDFPMVGEMARDGRLRGLLIRVDPRARRRSDALRPWRSRVLPAPRSNRRRRALPRL